MTKVEFFKNDNGDITRYIVDGHTGYDEYGKDIVCAAVSVLAQTGVISLIKVCDMSINYTIREGHIDVILPEDVDEEKWSKSQIVLQTILVGIKNTMEAYPNYITLRYREV
ncbi:ribosomal-processing cysteine protease Prp [Clostridium sp. D2Q-14]|uniref:ribosomal-processing cysteine protease Prp n=1 Tax=Anaeromonas gelatinilytica TaxID=2683194 RepID=UPI00193C76CC|nr:ribosomal-processing cysteine protease Prp [Anaeromonas gelatinilytica]MBS4535858.1 ribosomal-processing cysteine protease Prp [Anaeromonas gelatinilytica]